MERHEVKYDAQWIEHWYQWISYERRSTIDVGVPQRQFTAFIDVLIDLLFPYCSHLQQISIDCDGIFWIQYYLVEEYTEQY